MERVGLGLKLTLGRRTPFFQLEQILRLVAPDLALQLRDWVCRCAMSASSTSRCFRSCATRFSSTLPLNNARKLLCQPRLKFSFG